MAQKPIIDTRVGGMHCPRCDYDLRGMTHATCPECGTPFTMQDVAAHAKVRWRHERRFKRLLIVAWVWIATYVLPGDLLHGAVDRVDTIWVKLVFLNFPVQLLLAASAGVCLKTDHKRVKQLGGILTTVLLMLVVAHVVISLATT